MKIFAAHATALTLLAGLSGVAYAKDRPQSVPGTVIDGCLKGACRGGPATGSSSGSRFPSSNDAITRYDYSNYGLNNKSNVLGARGR